MSHFENFTGFSLWELTNPAKLTVGGILTVNGMIFGLYTFLF